MANGLDGFGARGDPDLLDTVPVDRRFREDSNLDELVSPERFVDLREHPRGQPFLPDLNDRLEMVREAAEPLSLLRRESHVQPMSRAAILAALYPHMPWTPPPGCA